MRSICADEREDTESSIFQPPKRFWVYLSSKVFECLRLRITRQCPKMPNLFSCHPIRATGPKELGCPPEQHILQTGAVWCRGAQVGPCRDTLDLEADWLGQYRSAFSSEDHQCLMLGFPTFLPWRCLRVQQCRPDSCYAEQKLLSPSTVQNPHGSKPGLGGVVCLRLQGPEAWLQNWDICVGWWSKLPVHGSCVRNQSCLDSAG